MNTKTAIIFGATGLIGDKLLRLLINDSRYSKIKVFTRNELIINDLKIEHHLVDFNKPEKYSSLVKGDDLFLCLGTTMKKAKTKKAFKFVDYEITTSAAEFGFNNGIKTLTVISSMGANPNSRNFYLRTKGEMEEAILKYRFIRTHILRPSLLLGERTDSRLGEKIASLIMRKVKPIMNGKLKKYQAIDAEIVANAMIKLANSKIDQKVIENAELFEIGKIL